MVNWSSTWYPQEVAYRHGDNGVAETPKGGPTPSGGAQLSV